MASIRTFSDAKEWGVLLTAYLEDHAGLCCDVPPNVTGVRGPITCHAAKGADAAARETDDDDDEARAGVRLDEGGPCFRNVTRANHTLEVGDAVSVYQRPPAQRWTRGTVAIIYPSHAVLDLDPPGTSCTYTPTTHITRTHATPRTPSSIYVRSPCYRCIRAHAQCGAVCAGTRCFVNRSVFTPTDYGARWVLHPSPPRGLHAPKIADAAEPRTIQKGDWLDVQSVSFWPGRWRTGQVVRVDDVAGTALIKYGPGCLAILPSVHARARVRARGREDGGEKYGEREHVCLCVCSCFVNISWQCFLGGTCVPRLDHSRMRVCARRPSPGI